MQCERLNTRGASDRLKKVLLDRRRGGVADGVGCGKVDSRRPLRRVPEDGGVCRGCSQAGRQQYMEDGVRIGGLSAVQCMPTSKTSFTIKQLSFSSRAAAGCASTNAGTRKVAAATPLSKHGSLSQCQKLCDTARSCSRALQASPNYERSHTRTARVCLCVCLVGWLLGGLIVWHTVPRMLRAPCAE